MAETAETVLRSDSKKIVETAVWGLPYLVPESKNAESAYLHRRSLRESFLVFFGINSHVILVKVEINPFSLLGASYHNFFKKLSLN